MAQPLSPWAAMPLGQVEPNEDDLAAYLAEVRPELFAAAMQQKAGKPQAASPVPSVPRGTPPPQPPPRAPQGGGDLQSLIGQLNQRELASLEQQGLTTDALRKQLASLEGQGLPDDWSGLMALTDAWTGSDFAQSYRPEETAQGRRAAVEKLRAAVTGAEQGLSENEIGLLRSQLNNQFQMDNLNYRREQDLFGNKLAENRLELDRDMRDAALATKTDEKLEHDIQELQKRSGEALPSMVEKLTTLDAILARQGKDIPGVGGIDTLAPDFMLGKDGQAIRQLGEDLRADVLKMYSGTAASDRERKQRLEAMGGSWKNTDAQFLQGLQYLRDSIAAKQKNIEGAFRPAVKAAFETRGGLTSDGVRTIPLQTKDSAAQKPQTREEKIAELKRRQGVK